MTNREKLSKMTLIDILMYLHFCNPVHSFTVARCVQYCGDCYKCRMDWLDEPVDVQPVKHGEWKINSDGYYPYCSVCGTAADQLTKHLTKYCPECGARMDGDENEDNS